MCITNKLFELLTRETVLLKVPRGEKGPKYKGWQKTTPIDMTEEYLNDLDSGMFNVGVLLGSASNHLCSIDIDDDSSIESFRLANPKLLQSLTTRGRRGINIWVRIHGEYPSLHKLKTTTGDAWGEWRANGSQTIIHGLHPDGMDYQIINGSSPVQLSFDEINWPENLILPWMTSASEAPTVGDFSELMKEHGQPIIVDERGNVSLNHGSIAAFFTTIHRVLYDEEDKEFYLYNADNGVWERKSAVYISGIVQDLVLNLMKNLGGSKKLGKITSNVIDSIVKIARPKVLADGAFSHRRNIIHLANGVVDLDPSEWCLTSFSDQYYSRSQCSIEYDEGAKCPRFLNELLTPCLSDEDIDLLQRVMGSFLLNGNRAQAVAMIIGAAGAGKSTLVKIIEKLVGKENIAGLRTKQLDSNFELQLFIGKRLLLGLDVSRRFLREPGADKIKALVGGDRLAVEKKYSSQGLSIEGDYHMLLTGNAMPLLNLDGDSEAWKRRIILIEWNDAKPLQRIPNFDRILIDEEGPGILNWALEGLRRHLHELDQFGRIILSKTQSHRVDNLINASDSVRAFVYSELDTVKGASISLTHLRDAYQSYCRRMEWEPSEKRDYKEAMDGTILERFGISESHDVELNGKSARGYRNISLIGR